jgi:hypothetical protein
MAGTILISGGAGVPLSSTAFDHLVQEIRRAMANPDEAEFADAYRPYDHEGMMFISLTALSSEAFQSFVATTRVAADACVQSHGQVLEGAWSELAQALAKDPRSGATR